MTMKLGLVSDIHAEAHALRSALEALVARGVDKILCAGDLVDKGPDGDEVVALVQSWLIPCVQGNHDLGAVESARLDGGSGLKAQTLAVLEGLPVTRRYLWEGCRVLLAHAAPYNQSTYVFPDDIPKAFKRKARGFDTDVLILGHTHRPMCIPYRGMWLVNPGSVCGQRPRDSHTCAILTLPTMDFEVIELGGV